MKGKIILANREKGAIRAQLLIYSTLCLICGLGPLALGWTQEWQRPIVWLLAVLGYRTIEETGFHPKETKGERHAEWLFYALYLALGGAVLLPAIEFALLPRPLRLPLVFLGVALAALGTSLRYQGVKTLGEHFSTHVEVRQGHALVDRGIYRLIRHPGYAGVMCFSAGSALIFHSYFSLAFSMLVFWPLILTRIAIEEEQMSANLEGYRNYMARSKRLIPHVF
jgi:protein-S-isoprenylcysteine O-methyltransferase Ste14